MILHFWYLLFADRLNFSHTKSIPLDKSVALETQRSISHLDLVRDMLDMSLAESKFLDNDKDQLQIH